MKKIIVLLMVLIAITIKLNAQIPNSGFETWNTVGSYQYPAGWATADTFSTGSFYSVSQSTDHFPTSVGNYSVMLQTNTSLLSNLSGIGIMMTGKSILDAPHPVFPVTGHPTSLTGYYKFDPQNGDTMCIRIFLYNAGVNVSQGILRNTVSTSSWTSFDIPLSNYTTADSGHIILQTFYDSSNSVPHGNSILYVDNLSFDNLITSVQEQSAENNAFSLYPNPANDIVTLDINNIKIEDFTLNIYNVIGALVKSETLSQNNRQINIRDLSNGVYLVAIKSKDLIENHRLIVQR